MARIRWAEVVPKAVEEAQGYKSEFGEAPTLRGIYYRLVSIEAIPNTKSAYKGLSAALSKARLEGTFPWSLMQDKTRSSTGQEAEFKVEAVLSLNEEEVADSLFSLKNAFDQIADPSVNRRASKWTNQPKRVVVAIEKEAIMGAVQNVLRGLDVEVFPLRGYTSTTFMREIAGSIRRLNRFADLPVELVIITDYDPSGEDMVRDVEDRLTMDFGVRVHAEKVLVTRGQIDAYNLPAIPEDAEEIAKLRRDPRYEGFGEGDFRVELDAMASIVPQEFRRIVRDAVTKHFDEGIEDRNKDRVNESNRAAENELRSLYTQLEEVHQMVLEKIAEITGEEGA